MLQNEEGAVTPKAGVILTSTSNNTVWARLWRADDLAALAGLAMLRGLWLAVSQDMSPIFRYAAWVKTM